MPPKPAKTPAKPRKPKDPNAPKRPRGRPRKDGNLARVKQEGKSPSSSYDSDSDSDLEVEEDPMPEILKHDRPDSFEGKVLYETVQAVWSPRHKSAVPDSIRAGIAQFGETIRKLRDAWKAKNAALQQAENTNSAAVPSLKEEVGQYRRLMQSVAEKAVELGHPAHLKKYVYNPLFLLHSRQLSAGSSSLAAEITSKYVHVEMKIYPICQRLNECHSKGLAMFLECPKARPDRVLSRVLGINSLQYQVRLSDQLSLVISGTLSWIWSLYTCTCGCKRCYPQTTEASDLVLIFVQTR